MRSAVSAAALLLTACSQENAAPSPDPASLIECALAGAAAFKRECAGERRETAHGGVLTVLHPNGGFRPFALADDGQSLTAADGAQTASVMKHEEAFEVTVGLDRYRIPPGALSRDGD